jgi:membrane protein DedA with SNARE-associated domain
VSAQLTHYIAEFGYVAIFLIVFLQELGVPNPVTNEFILLFSGYLAFSGVLNFWLVFLTAVSADFIGTTLLYAVFYRCGAWILAHRAKWIPVSAARLERIASRISSRQRWSIYVARLVPFVRGYASVAAGLMPIPPRVFIPAVAISAVTWSGGYVTAGRLLGPYWERAAHRIGSVEVAVVVGILTLAAALIGRAVVRSGRQPA